MRGEVVMREFFCSCKYCQMQKTRFWAGVRSFFGALMWLIAPPRYVPLPIRDEDDPQTH